MEKARIPRYGREFSGEAGWIAEIGRSVWHHRFGGESWRVIDPEPAFGGPTLLVTIDTRQPGLEALRLMGCDELPLCSYVNCDIWVGKQVFGILSKERQVHLISRDIIRPTPLSQECVLPSPFPERPLRLRPMRGEEIPSDEQTYWLACDSFVGGEAFIRILGPPLWLDEPVNVDCVCGLAARYVASIGYENYDRPSGLLEGQSFFLGEGALYFFLCQDCLRLIVVSQGT